MSTEKPAFRVETDSMGAIEVPADRYWGAQTQRSLVHFSIGEERMPREVVLALALLKKAAAQANLEMGVLAPEKARLIVAACDEVLAGRLDDHFPLRVWMTGSGTQSNMNVNEVVANRANEMAGAALGSKAPVHPNDHVNMSQSSNDIFPSAMYIAAARELSGRMVPAVRALRDGLDEKARLWADLPKIGRTHLMDAVPMTLGQEFSGYVALLDENLERLAFVLPALHRLALGGTAVGTGLNARPGFAARALSHVRTMTGLPFEEAPNKFAALSAHDALVMASGALRTLAVSLNKLACDIRLLGSGPRCGLGELILPANEPGSSIMPGKVNPTQCEVMSMAAVQVMGLDAAVAMAGAGGMLELNVYKPVMIANVLTSVRLLSDVCGNFNEFLVRGLEPNRTQIGVHLNRSLMLVTALSPAIGYDKAAEVAHKASAENLTLREAALALGYVSEAEFDRLVDPVRLAKPGG